MIGIGDRHCQLAVYIANRPPLDEYQDRETIIPTVDGELARIGRETGNHWRKIINIYAKLGFLLDSQSFATWQNYRDSHLLTEGSAQALLFDAHLVTLPKHAISLICGKTHAAELVEEKALHWIDPYFAVCKSKRLIVTPYFDYRQLSNAKLEILVELINQF